MIVDGKESKRHTEKELHEAINWVMAERGCNMDDLVSYLQQVAQCQNFDAFGKMSDKLPLEIIERDTVWAYTVVCNGKEVGWYKKKGSEMEPHHYETASLYGSQPEHLSDFYTQFFNKSSDRTPEGIRNFYTQEYNPAKEQDFVTNAGVKGNYETPPEDKENEMEKE